MSDSILQRLERVERMLDDVPIQIGGKSELERRLEDQKAADIYRRYGMAAYRVERHRLNKERREALGQ